MNRTTTSLFFILLLAFHVISTQGQKCEEYQGEICKGYINYPVYVVLPQVIFEETLKSLEIPRLINQGGKVDPPCKNAALDFICSEYFPRCVVPQNSTTPVPLRPCLSLCQSFVNECTDLVQAIGKGSAIPPCNVSVLTSSPYSTTNCQEKTLSTALPEDFECVAPLIRDPGGETNPSTTCFGYCCVPCPLTHYFFKENEINKVDKVIMSVAIISTFASLFVIISFAMMKNKRNFPSYLVIFTAVGLIIFYFPAFFSIGDPSRARCITPVTTSYFGYNTNGICQAQSILVVYGVLLASGWYFTLVLNIHLIVVWRRELTDYLYYLIGLFFTLPVISLIAYNSANKSGYLLGVWCTIEIGGWLNGALMVPLAVFIFASSIFNLATLYKIFVVARGTKSQMSKIIKLQLRPFLFVFTIVAVFMFYWVHFEVVLAPLDISLTNEPPKWVEEWVICILSGLGQNECSKYSSPNLFNVPLFAFSEFGIHTLGIIIFAFFGARIEVFNFWFGKITGKEITLSSGNGTSTSGKTSSKLDLAARELQKTPSQTLEPPTEA